VINVVLNIIFVVVFHLHVIGVAVATVISNLFSAGIIVWILMHEEEAFRLSFRKLSINLENFTAILKVGLPAGLQGIIFSLSNIVIQSSINSFGANAIAGSTAAQNFEFMVYCVVNAFSQTAVTFTSQNFSAGKYDRCRKVFTLSMAIGLCAGAIVGAVFALSRNTVIRLFTTDPAVIQFAVTRMLVVCLLDWMTGLYEISGGCLRGMGRSMTPAMLTVVGSCGVRLLWVWTVVAAFHEFHILLMVYPVSWLITGGMVLFAYFTARKRLFHDFS
jgi:Na+-driven multidrug efflux pump